MNSELSIALLRGINVGGKNKLPMKPLVEAFVAAGCTNVRPYLQSGNVIFMPGRIAEAAALVKQWIESEYGLNLPITVRTASQVRLLVRANPFLSADRSLTKEVDPSCLHVMFLEHEPSAAQTALLDLNRSRPDEFVVVGRHIYLHLPKGAAKTRLTNAYFDLRLKTVGTQRNWRTVTALAEMMNVAVDDPSGLET